MTTLGIFTVKKICLSNGQYFTYGGFGDYLAAMRSSFTKVILVAHVKVGVPPKGHYLIPPGNNLEIIQLPQVRSELGTWLIMPMVIWRCWKASKNMDVAHARMPNHTGVIGAFVCDMRGVPVFCQIIDDWYIAAKRMPWTKKYGLGLLMKYHLFLYDWLERFVCRGKLVFAQGITCYEKHKNHSDCELVLSTAHYLADIAIPRPKFIRSPYTLLTVARLTGVKNQQLTLKALAELRQAGEDWRFILVGDGPHLKQLEALAKELCLGDSVIFAGQANRGDELWNYFDTADCFVLSSRSEGTPKVLLEAMARGLPIVATNVAGVPSSIKHEERGLLIEDNDVNGLILAIQRMRNDSSLRDYMVSNASEFCKQHTVERATENMLERVFNLWPNLREIS